VGESVSVIASVVFRVILGKFFAIFSRSKIFLVLLLLSMIAGINAVLFYIVEVVWGGVKLNFFDALYWSVITMATIGYGDITPQTLGGKLIAIYASLTGIAVFTLTISVIAERFLSGAIKKTMGLVKLKGIDIAVIGDSEECLELIRELKDNVPNTKISLITNEVPKTDVVKDYVVGDLTSNEVLIRGGADKAKIIAICTKDDSQAIHLSLLLKRLNRSAKLVSIARSSMGEELLKETGVDFIASVRLVARQLASAVFEPSVAILLNDLTTSKGVGDLIEVKADNYAGYKFEDLLAEAKKNSGLLPIAVVKSEGEVILNPSTDYIIQPTDRIVFIKGSGIIKTR
jgi:voltage-gated potassium channel